MTLAQRVDRVVTALAVLFVIAAVSTGIAWYHRRPQTTGSVVAGKRVVIDETQGNARVDYLLTITTAGGKREEIAVPAEVYQRADVGAHIARRDGKYVVTP